MLLKNIKEEKLGTGLLTHSLCHLHLTASDSPESPERISAVGDRLFASGLTQAFEIIETRREATREDLLRAHTAQYIDFIQSRVPPDEKQVVMISEDTGIGKYSYEAALQSAGCVLEACDRVVRGELNNAFCCIRPPGHHAHRDKAEGFCLFNNVAIGALYAREVLKLQKVAILDIDVHHGDGTEDIVKDRDDLLLCSWYQEGIFPNITKTRWPANVHARALKAGSTGDEACQIIRSEWGPVLQAFQPELIMISAGFDAHANDTMSALDFSDLDYAHITRIINDIAKTLCGAKVVSVLEGGYEPRSLSRSVVAHIRTLADL